MLTNEQPEIPVVYGEAHYARESMCVGSRFDLDTLSSNPWLIRIVVCRVVVSYEARVRKLHGERTPRECEVANLLSIGSSGRRVSAMFSLREAEGVE